MLIVIFVVFLYIRDIKIDLGVWRLGVSDYVFLFCSVGKVVM